MGNHSGERQFSDLVGSIYDAALEPDGWAAVVAKMKQYLNSPTAQIYNEDVRVRGATFAVMDGLDRSLMDRYYRHYVFLDPNLTAKKKLPVGTVTASNNLMLENQWENTEYYYDFARLAGVFYQLGAYTHRGPGAFGAVGVQRPRSSNPFSRSDISRMQRIVPHVRQAFRTSSLLAGAQGTLAALMELHPHAVFLIDAGGRIVLANRRGEGLLRQRDGLISADGRLSALTASGKAGLARAIHIAVMTGIGKGVHPGQALTIDRPSGASAHQVLVTPLHQLPARFDGGPSRICAAVFVAGPQAAPTASSNALREKFELTPAEARVALAITEGLSIKEIAERSATSPKTVRNQLKVVFSKSGVHRQAELVRLLLASPTSACDASTEQEGTGS